jgi:hypothetical protein
MNPEYFHADASWRLGAAHLFLREEPDEEEDEEEDQRDDKTGNDEDETEAGYSE